MKRTDLPVLPLQSGCYLYLNAEGKALYVGKAKNLRSRVRSYFGRTADQKARHLVRDAASLEFIVTTDEVEALILESNLIKRHKPHYNVLLKDDKSYPFLKLTNERYPTLILTRLVVDDGGTYYGPYPSAGSVRSVLDLVYSVFRLRKNSGVPMQTRKKPCLRYHMGRCQAPCSMPVDDAEYASTVRQVKAFLEGRIDETVAALKADMQAAAARQDFELAGTYRDRLEALTRITGYDSSIVQGKADDLDFLGVAIAGNFAMVQLFQMRLGRVVGRDKRFLSNAAGASEAEVLERFMAEYYGQATQIAPQVLVPAGGSASDPSGSPGGDPVADPGGEPGGEPGVEPGGTSGPDPVGGPAAELDLDVWSRFLTARAGRKVRVSTPRRGDKVELMGMAERNARTGVEAEIALLERRGEAPGVGELQKLLDLEAPPWRIEGFDISNLMGEHTVASIVVFEGGRAKRSDYRKLRIRDLDKPDDFYSMHQAVKRRFAGSLADKMPVPDLLLIDGGKGQLSAARRALADAGMEIPMVGLAKKQETLITEAGKEVIVPHSHPALKLLIHVRDEAHRTAVGYNRQRRGKALTRSILDDVPGIGPKRRDALLARFSSVEELRQADLPTLAAIPGVGMVAARAVMDFFAAGAQPSQGQSTT